LGNQVTVAITSITPALGDFTRDTILEAKGSGFTAGTRMFLISPTTPPQAYPLGSVQFVDSFTVRVRIGAGNVPVGIYDVYADNGGVDNFTLSQVYRSAPPLPANPWTSQTFEVVMARAMQNLNPPTNPTKYDIRPGNTIWDINAPSGRIIHEFYRVLYQLFKLAFPQYSTGTLLTLHAEAHGVIREVAQFATGVVKTTAPAGSTLPTGLTFSTGIIAGSAAPPVTYTSTETASKVQKNPVTGTASSADATSLTDSSKTFVSNEWTNGYIWITGGTGVGELRKILANTATIITPVTPWDTGLIPDATSTYQLFSGVDVIADVRGSIGNVGVGTINRLRSQVSFITAVTNPIALGDGTDDETDASLLSRLLLKVRNPSSGGNIADYQIWATETPGVSLGSVAVIPLWAGNGTVKVVIINSDNTVPTAGIVAAVQNYIDPVAGQGLGKAPIGQVATVVAATPVAIDVAVAVTPYAGYAGSTVRSQVQTSVAYYLNSVATGDDVLYIGVQNAILNSIQDENGNWIRNLGVGDYDIQSTGHGIKRSTSGTWTTANVVIAGTEKSIAGTITVT
jgi:uncharacterized phage protein gp47/JayE